MSDPATDDYFPNDTFPDLQNRDGNGPLVFQESGTVLNSFFTWGKTSVVASVSNTTPIVITTTAPHKLSTGAKVGVRDTTITAANGDWTVIVLSPTTFSLTGSTAGGAHSGDGLAFSLNIGLFARAIDGLWYLGKRLLGTAFDTGIVSIQGRKVLCRPVVVLSDANHTIDVSMGDVFQVSSAPAAPRTITLKQTTAPIPLPGESIKIITSSGLVVGKQYTIARESSSQVAEFWGSAGEDIVVTAEFIFGAEWLLGPNCGGGGTGGVVG